VYLPIHRRLRSVQTPLSGGSLGAITIEHRSVIEPVLLNGRLECADIHHVKRSCVVLMIALLISSCAAKSSPPTTFGVDGAPDILTNTYLTVVREAATLAVYDATDDQWLDFARTVCAADITTASQLSEFVDERPGASADLHQMWSTAASAATTAFCPLGEG
jgi:predicted outer membrane protein